MTRCPVCGRKRPVYDYEDEIGEMHPMCVECAERRSGE